MTYQNDNVHSGIKHFKQKLARWVLICIAFAGLFRGVTARLSDDDREIVEEWFKKSKEALSSSSSLSEVDKLLGYAGKEVGAKLSDKDRAIVGEWFQQSKEALFARLDIDDASSSSSREPSHDSYSKAFVDLNSNFGNDCPEHNASERLLGDASSYADSTPEAGSAQDGPNGGARDSAAVRCGLTAAEPSDTAATPRMFNAALAEPSVTAGNKGGLCEQGQLRRQTKRLHDSTLSFRESTPVLTTDDADPFGHLPAQSECRSTPASQANATLPPAFGPEKKKTEDYSKWAKLRVTDWVKKTVFPNEPTEQQYVKFFWRKQVDGYKLRTLTSKKIKEWVVGGDTIPNEAIKKIMSEIKKLFPDLK